MSTQKAKFALFQRLQNLGFTYEEAVQLRRIEMTLQRWSERECGGDSNWAIERAEPRKLAIWCDGNRPDGLKIVSLCPNGRRIEDVKILPDHIKAGNDPKVFPPEAVAILERFQRLEIETDGKPFNVYHGEGKSRRYPIADREAGALRRLKAIVDARNLRATTDNEAGNFVLPYHQTDPRGCALYLITRAHLGAADISSCYTNGLSVCC